MHRSRQIIAIFLFVLLVSACRAKQDGAIEGAIVPRGLPASITAIRDEKEVLTVPAGVQDGTFKLALSAGIYSLRVTASGYPYPLQMNDIAVQPGKSTFLPPFDLTASSGKGVLSVNVVPPCPDARVTLICEGRERAVMRADAGGKYHFRELSTGTYVVKADAPGYAEDSTQVVVTDDQKKEQAIILLPVTPIEGVDWASGKIHSTGIGMPPRDEANVTVRREMAKRAALTDARRNMLRTIEQIRIDAHQDIKFAMRKKSIAVKIEGFIQGAVIISERELEDGDYEVVLELPLSGSAGLTRYLSE